MFDGRKNWNNKNMKKKGLSSVQLILLSFLAAIVVGTALLLLPVSHAHGVSVSLVDALFMAVTSVCVTGLVPFVTVNTWSVFGQIVILALIQIGGLGVITMIASVLLLMGKKLGIQDRLLIQDAFNLNTLSGLVRFIKKEMIGTLVVEGCGALLCLPVFVPEFGMRGIWISVFHSVSAFCNAGIDILGERSLCGYAVNGYLNLVTDALIVLGGLGYVVWWDVLRVVKSRTKQNRRIFRHLTLHSKIALVSTGVLTVVGTVLIFVFEHQNPRTLAGYSLSDQLMISFFQSVTTRTAGFAAIEQELLRTPTALVCLILMFVGGSPVGTAGGVKTVTMAVLLGSAVSVIQDRNDIIMFQRRIPQHALSKATAVVMVSFFTVFVSSVTLSLVCDASLLDVLYETVSAAATVGLSRNLTGSLNWIGKLIVIVTMYFGRVGPITVALAFGNKKESQNFIKNPLEEISVG